MYALRYLLASVTIGLCIVAPADIQYRPGHTCRLRCLDNFDVTPCERMKKGDRERCKEHLRELYHACVRRCKR